MQVCEFPRRAFQDSCPSELVAGVGSWEGPGQGGVVPLGLCSRLQGTGGLRTSASLTWCRLPTQCPMTDGTTLRTVSWSLSLRRVSES